MKQIRWTITHRKKLSHMIYTYMFSVDKSKGSSSKFHQQYDNDKNKVLKRGNLLVKTSFFLLLINYVMKKDIVPFIHIIV